MKTAAVVVKPELHLSEGTARIKIARFVAEAERDIGQRNELAEKRNLQYRKKYRKQLSCFRALYGDPILGDLVFVVQDDPKRIMGFRLFHAEHAGAKQSYFFLRMFVITNKTWKSLPPGQPVNITIGNHTLARILERCSIGLTLDIRGIRALLIKLLFKALSATFDENGVARLGLDQFPDMIFVCCKDRWLERDYELPAYYSIVTYYEK